MSEFKKHWNEINGHFEHDDYLIKSALTRQEISSIRKTISELTSKGLPSSKIITQLQKTNSKLNERWRAERVYWTESKKQDTELVGNAGDNLDVEKYQVILSPSACETCRKASDNGKKIFKTSDLKQSGYGHTPPFHPNCYCIIIPK